MEKLHIQPSELDMLPYYEYEYTLEIYNDIIKDRNEEEGKQSKQSKSSDDYNSMYKSSQKQMSSFKAPSMPKITMPRL